MIRLAVIVGFVLGSLGMYAQADTCACSHHKPQASNLKPQTYQAFFLEAMIHRQKGNSDAAFDLLRRCVETDSTASEAYFFLSQYYNELKDTDKAMACIRKAASLEPDNTTYMETLAQAEIQQKNYLAATSVIEQLYKENKDREDLLEMLYSLYMQEDDYTHAIGVLESLEAIDGKSERLTYTKSNLYTKMGNKRAAIEEMKSLSDQYPNDLGYLGLYGDMLMMNDEHEQARQIYERILAEEPDNSRGQISMLNYLREQQQNERADSMATAILLNRQTPAEQKIYLLRQIIQENESGGGDSTKVLALFHKMLAQPSPEVAVATVCAAYMELKKMPRDSIAAVLEQILTLEPDNAPARLQLVSYAWADKDLDRIISICSAARQYNPDEMAFYYYQGIAHYQKGEHAEALSAFQNGIGVINEDSNPAIVSDFYAVMGDLLHEEGRAREAFEAYDSCLMHVPDNLMCLNNYAYYLSEMGQQLDKAEQMSYKTIKAEPQNPTFLDTYAWILFVQERYSEAKIYIDQALQNDSDSNAVIIEHAGDIYMKNHDVQRALELWNEALRQNPDNKKLFRKIKLKKYLK